MKAAWTKIEDAVNETYTADAYGKHIVLVIDRNGNQFYSDGDYEIMDNDAIMTPEEAADEIDRRWEIENQ